MKHNSPFVCLVDPNINVLTSIKVQRTELFNRKHPGLWETVLNRMWSNQPNLKITYKHFILNFSVKMWCVFTNIFQHFFFFLLFFLLHDTFFSKCCAIFFQNNSLFSLNISFFPQNIKNNVLEIFSFFCKYHNFSSKYYIFFLKILQLFSLTMTTFSHNITALFWKHYDFTVFWK